MTRLKNRTDPPRVPLPLLPKPFTGAPSHDVRSWLHSLDTVFFTRGVVSLEDKLYWVVGFVEGPAAPFLATLQDVNTWEQFKELWTAKCTLYSTDVKHRRHFHAIRQESDDVEQYITEFAKFKLGCQPKRGGSSHGVFRWPGHETTTTFVSGTGHHHCRCPPPHSSVLFGPQPYYS